jgi:hypothetical protein
MGPLLVGLGIGLGIAMHSTRPAIVDAHPVAFFVFLAVALLLAWWGGWRRSAHASAVAVAQARADARAAAEAAAVSDSSASATSAVQVFVGDGGQAVRPPRPSEELDRAEWYGSRDLGAEVVAQLAERGSDDGLAEILDEHQELPDHAE